MEQAAADALDLLDGMEEGEQEFWETKPQLIFTDKGWTLGAVLCKICARVDCDLPDAGRRRTYCNGHVSPDMTIAIDEPPTEHVCSPGCAHDEEPCDHEEWDRCEKCDPTPADVKEPPCETCLDKVHRGTGPQGCPECMEEGYAYYRPEKEERL